MQHFHARLTTADTQKFGCITPKTTGMTKTKQNPLSTVNSEFKIYELKKSSGEPQRYVLEKQPLK